MSIPARASTPVYRGRASGKIILFGEHAVLYDAGALGFPLDVGVEATLKAGEGRVRALDGFQKKWVQLPPQDARSLFVAHALGKDAKRFDTDLRLQFPPGAGLGASAAIAVI